MNRISLATLARAGRTLALPGSLDLPMGRLDLELTHRWLPGRRLTARARWQGRNVLAKLFVGPGWRAHWKAECAGAQELAQAGIPTATLRECGHDNQGGWLLYDYLEPSRTATATWLTAGADERPAQLAALGALFGRLHAHGLSHDDPHWDNLLWHQGRLHMVDAGAVRLHPNPMPLRAALDNFGWVLAQRPPQELGTAAAAVQAYHAQPAAPQFGADALDAARQAGWRRRLRDFMSKTARECTLFAYGKRWRERRALLRAQAALLEPLLDDPEAALTRATLLKQGGSATVGRLQVEAHMLVIKRYNLKNWLHRLRRCLRDTRAWVSWREGHRLQFCGIATPTPLAVIERRFGPLRGRAYLITEHCPGQDILARARHWGERVPEADAFALAELFRALIAHRISHGDMKGTNLLWNGERYALIDLDGMRQHTEAAGFARAHATDRARLLANWPEGSPIRTQLETLLPAP